MNFEVIQIDTRGVAMDIAMRTSREPYIRDLTTVSAFIDSQYFTICGIIAKFWQAQVSNQKACTVQSVQREIASLVDGAFCRTSSMFSMPQLQSFKAAFFEAMVSAYYARVPAVSTNWDTVELVRIDMENYVLHCTRTFASIPSFTGFHPSLMSVR